MNKGLEIEKLEKEIFRLGNLLMDSMYANAKANEARSEVVADNERLQKENECLRGLLRECQPHIDAADGEVESELCDKVEGVLGHE